MSRFGMMTESERLIARNNTNYRLSSVALVAEACETLLTQRGDRAARRAVVFGMGP